MAMPPVWNVNQHKITYYVTEAPARHKATCSCRRSSPFADTRQEIDDWVFVHRTQVERAKAWLDTRTPRLTHQRDYFRHMATEEPGVSPTDRLLWEKLAEELDHRIGHPHTEEPLF